MNIYAVLEQIAHFKMKTMGIKSRMIHTPVGKQHLYDIPGQGKLPTLVILHGIGGNSVSFEKIIYMLRRSFRRIILPEAPAHGFSDEPFLPVSAEIIYQGVTSIINSELEEPAIIFGNSMGGGIALKYASENPAAVLGLILCSPGGAPMEQEEFQEFLNTFRVKDFLDAVNFASDLIHKPSIISFLAAPHILSTVGSPVIQELINNISTDFLLNPEDLKSLNMPVNLIWGKSEKIMLPRHLEFFKKNLPSHTVFDEPEDFGHCPFIDKPAKLAARIVSFSEKISQAPVR
jgi:pimeloyl-ACP methyl ester carboxylesterase